MQLNQSQIREETDSMKQEQGFSLIELLIVVAIIAIIAAIAVPSMLQARMAANESGAIQGCRTIGSAEMSYAAINNQTYTDISTLATDGYLDDRFGGTPAKFSGYTYADSNDANLGVTANPSGFGADATPDANLGRFIYGIGPDQVVRYLGSITGTDMVCGASDCAAGEAIGTQHGS
jgi:type IV pilus assembly protein PilA